MSVLLMGLDDDFGPVLVRKLVGEGDTVGVIDTNEDRAMRWRQLGAHVAKGSPEDADLIERAAQHARSIVVVEPTEIDPTAVVAAVVQGARLVPGEAPRIVYVGENASAHGILTSSGLDHVILRRGRRRGLSLRSSKPSAAELAEAVNAADDLAGAPALVLDLATPRAWAALGLEKN